MPSRTDCARAALLLACLLGAATPCPPAQAQPAGAASQAAPRPPGTVPDDVDVQQAIKAVRNDPLMGGLHTVKRLHWLPHDKDEPGRRLPWLERLYAWIAALAAWIARSARALVIVAAVIGVALLAVAILRAVQRRGRPALSAEAAPPTHVRGLDIRPEEIPQDVARAARNAWARGDRRAAMVLLYRALLSRLVHGYRVAIRDSSTEGDCARLAAQALGAEPLEYVSRFIASWQRAMYAAAWPVEAEFEQLCAGFEQALPAGRTAVP